MADEQEVSEERLRALLAEQAESAQLDYKQTCNLNERPDVVTLARHVGAMQLLGGHIVVGADNAGHPSDRFTAELAALFDEATLRLKLARYLPESVVVRCAIHALDGRSFVVVHVARHPDGLVPFQADGEYEVHGRKKCAFRRGQIYVRHGTSSEPCSLEDVRTALAHSLERQLERLRRERAAELTQLVRELRETADLAKAPAASLDWKLDEDSFLATIVEQLRVGDDIPLRLLLKRASTDAHRLGAADERPALEALLDRLACGAVTLWSVERTALAGEVIDALSRIYNSGFELTRSSSGTPPSLLWLLVIQRVVALGAYLVREERWQEAAALVRMQPVDRRHADRPPTHVTWIRHATTHASRAGHFTEAVGGRQADVSLLWMAKQLIDRHDCLRQGLFQDDERLLDSICQFDMLAMLVSVGTAGTRHSSVYYPHFARFHEYRSLPVLNKIIRDRAARDAVFPNRSEQELADAIRWINAAATRQGFDYAGWDGEFLGETIYEFLRKHPVQE